MNDLSATVINTLVDRFIQTLGKFCDHIFFNFSIQVSLCCYSTYTTSKQVAAHPSSHYCKSTTHHFSVAVAKYPPSLINSRPRNYQKSSRVSNLQTGKPLVNCLLDFSVFMPTLTGVVKWSPLVEATALSRIIVLA